MCSIEGSSERIRHSLIAATKPGISTIDVVELQHLQYSLHVSSSSVGSERRPKGEAMTRLVMTTAVVTDDMTSLAIGRSPESNPRSKIALPERNTAAIDRTKSPIGRSTDHRTRYSRATPTPANARPVFQYESSGKICSLEEIGQGPVVRMTIRTPFLRQLFDTSLPRSRSPRQDHPSISARCVFRRSDK